MSSSGRYQSKVLSFFSRQSRRWVDQSKVAVRTWSDRTLWNLRVVATWGTQILLYPVYAVFQATRMVGRQLQQVRQKFPLLQGSKFGGQKGRGAGEQGSGAIVPTTDAPILWVLEAVADFALPVLDGGLPAIAALSPGDDREANLVLSHAGELSQTRLTESGLAGRSRRTSELSISAKGELTRDAVGGSVERQRVKVQGVASLLENRRLVLVTAQNQLLDILTSEQQSHLRQRIIWEVAGYWRQVREFLAIHQKPVSPLPPPVVDRPHLLPPVRAFYQLMGWVQTGPVAISINLFKEFALLPSAKGSFQLTEIPQRSQRVRLSQPFHAAMLENCEAEAWLTYGDLWGEPEEIYLSATTPFDWEKIQETELSRATVPPLPGDTQLTVPIALPSALNFNVATHSIKNLVKFYVRQAQSAVVRVESRSSDLDENPQQNGALAKTHQVSSPVVSAKGRSAISPDASNATVTSQSRQKIQVLPVASAEPLATATQSQQVVHSETEGSQQTNSPAHQPDWIETEAIVTGYIKHPLEQVLQWVDRVLLWLEDMATKLWKWFHQSSRNKR
jgi:hypothetical protein